MIAKGVHVNGEQQQQEPSAESADPGCGQVLVHARQPFNEQRRHGSSQRHRGHHDAGRQFEVVGKQLLRNRHQQRDHRGHNTGQGNAQQDHRSELTAGPEHLPGAERRGRVGQRLGGLGGGRGPD